LALAAIQTLQSCLLIVASEAAPDWPAWSLELVQPVVATVPASNPAMAAEVIHVLTVNFILVLALSVSLDSSFHPTRSKTMRSNLGASSSGFGATPYNISLHIKSASDGRLLCWT
jgi:hypothetical protein